MKNITITKLKHGQRIRVKGLALNKTTVGTNRGVSLEIGECPKESAARAESLGHELVWAIQGCSVLTDNYPGKKDDLRKEKLANQLAVEIAKGELVEIEGDIYKVVINGSQFSDPIRFEKTKQEQA